MDFLINHLISLGVLKTPHIIDAFRKIDRADFVPENSKIHAFVDEALPIGHGQTISQPYTVAFMLELLMPKAHDKILEIGYGSGWQTSILAEIVGNPVSDNKFNEFKDAIVGNPVSDNCGKVYAIEIIKELCQFGKENINKYSFIKKGIVKTYCADAEFGLPKIARKIGGFDKIIAAAALTEDPPDAWKKQLKIGGVMVLPIMNSLWRFVKKSDDKFDAKEFPGFSFVPFV